MERKVYKFRTGQTLPKDAIYLTTITKGKYVLHYFIVEVKEVKEKKK